MKKIIFLLTVAAFFGLNTHAMKKDFHAAALGYDKLLKKYEAGKKKQWKSLKEKQKALAIINELISIFNKDSSIYTERSNELKEMLKLAREERSLLIFLKPSFN